ncbi:hypothetical protein IT084_02545 [Desulfallas sp. Bu1-1]|uniref:hypothetical protein n=1 Tax=Desulfallas sp. Bu1-1 TaxID=2787620 RepID=UPI0018A01CEF|nr:hypothetical protein [Desulfallas sp. Bu1-1]MBF7081853.1 hypothetical protein [Desulfallas sp. Bu1-1]
MTDAETKIINGVEIDLKKANRMLKRLIVKETTNIKTKRYNDSEMAKQIKKIIEEEVECY